MIAKIQRDARRLTRFVAVGAVSTIASYALFFVLGLFLPAWLAYTIAFAAGLVWTTLASSRWVFGNRFSWARSLAYATLYLAIFGIGQLIIRLIAPTGWGELLLTSAVVLIVTTPLAFLGGRFIFGRLGSANSDLTGKDSHA